MIKNNLIKTYNNNMMSWSQSEQEINLKKKIKKS